MKKISVLALCLLGATVVAEEERRIVDASDDGLVTISNTAGSIEVNGWSRNEVEVVADLGRKVEELIVERDGNEVQVKVKLPRGRSHGSSSNSDLVVNVPERSSLKITGVSAGITVENVLGAQRLNTVSGDIETDAYGSDIDADSVSGDIEIEGDGQDMRTRANSVSGDVEVRDLAGDIELGSVSGDVQIESGSFARAAMHTTNGDIVFHAGLRDSGRLDIETINGDVNIQFDGEVSARFDIETFNGDINNCFGPQAERTSRYAPGRELIFNEGGATGRVTIRTLNGDLRMCRD